MNEFIQNHRASVFIVAFVAVALIAFGVGRFSGPETPGAQDTAEAPPKPADSVQVTDASLKLMDIGVEPAATGDLSAEIVAPGTVSASVNGDALVTAHAAGSVTRVTKRLGDSVKAGDVLALVTSRDAATMAAERRSTESKAELARSVLKRERELFEQRVTPRQDLEAAQAAADAAEADAARARIAAQAAHVSSDGGALAVVSPIDGRITSTSVALGQYVEPDTPLFRVADPRFVVVEVSIPATDARRIQPGDKAEVTTNSGASLAATVASVTPTVSSQTGSATAVLALAESPSLPVPGEFVRARVTPKSAGATDIVVPDEAVQSLNARDVVFVREGEAFRIRPVTIMARSGGRVSIRAGLRAGEPIATRNAFLLKAEVNKGAEEEE